MASPTRIACIGAAESPLPRMLATLLDRPVIRNLPDLAAHAQDLLSFAPELVFVERDRPDQRFVGALELLTALLPRSRTVVVCPRGSEVEARPICATVGALLLPSPVERGELVVLLSSLRADAFGSALATLHDFLRGLSDEVNNPLQYVQGNLQLLSLDLDAAAHSDRAAQFQAVREGLNRISDTFDRIRILARAGTARHAVSAVPLKPLLDEAVKLVRQQTHVALLPATFPQTGSFVTLGDVELLRAAFQHLLRVGAELTAGRPPLLTVQTAEPRIAVTLAVDATAAHDWQLPQSFAPYYLTKVLKASPHGLSLFLVQTIVHALGGEATARRVDERGLEFELRLPSA